MAEKKQIPITSLDRQTPNFPYDIKNLMYFLAPEMKVIIHQDLKKEALLYLKQDSTILNQKVSEYAKKYFLALNVPERTDNPDMVNSLDQGGALIAPGHGHLHGNEGCVNILKKLGYTFKPFKIKISLDTIFEKEYTEKYLTDIEFLADINASSVLSKLAQAYHQNTLTSDQQEMLNVILKIFMPSKDCKDNNPLNYCERNSLAILNSFFAMKNFKNLDKEDLISTSISFLF